jgi:hypothetical protein
MALQAGIGRFEPGVSGQVKKSCFCRTEFAQAIKLHCGRGQINLVATNAIAERLRGSNLPKRAGYPFRPRAFMVAAPEGMNKIVLQQELIKDMRADESVSASNDGGFHGILTDSRLSSKVSNQKRGKGVSP